MKIGEVIVRFPLNLPNRDLGRTVLISHPPWNLLVVHVAFFSCRFLCLSPLVDVAYFELAAPRWPITP